VDKKQMNNQEIATLHTLKEIGFRLNHVKEKCYGREVEEDIEKIVAKLDELYEQCKNQNGESVTVQPWFDKELKVPGIKVNVSWKKAMTIVSWPFRKLFGRKEK
jgi:hypothetical protein